MLILLVMTFLVTRSDTGRNSAKNPVIAAFYLQDKIELEDLVLNLGLRYDYFDPAYDGIADVERVTTETLGKWCR